LADVIASYASLGARQTAAYFHYLQVRNPAGTRTLAAEKRSGCSTSRTPASFSRSRAPTPKLLDASLHYNLRTDEVGLLKTPFPEHRDMASHTIYVRETCVAALRAKCRHLRETQTLEREWKVSPTIHLLTPGEWRSAALNRRDPRGDAFAIRSLNDERIAQLPEGVRRQFRLNPLEERSTQNADMPRGERQSPFTST
jgi:hypothetical protein